MGGPSETLFVSCSSSELWSTSIYNAKTGLSLWSYKGTELLGKSASSAGIISSQYLALSVLGKPVMNFIGLQRKNASHVRSVLPGTVNCFDISPCGTLLCAGIEERLYTWMLNNGQLLSIQTAHYQALSHVRFTSDSFFVITAGKDGVVNVFDVGDLMAPGDTTLHKVQPIHTWHHHSLPLTSIHVTDGGIRGRVFSASFDLTVKMTSLFTGDLLLSLIFEVMPTAVTSDPAEMRLFVGTLTGDIHVIDLGEEVTRRERYISKISSGPMGKSSNVLAGQSARITDLSVNLDATMLASGSDDGAVRVWCLGSNQCIRTIATTGGVTVCRFIAFPPSLQGDEASALMPIASLQKEVKSSVDCIYARLDKYQQPEKTEDILRSITKDGDSGSFHFIDDTRIDEDDGAKMAELEKKLSDAQKINKDLYNFAINKILS